jgi:antibiotic biosynthesis monooxygenase (ABM) superfamily enzyme
MAQEDNTKMTWVWLVGIIVIIILIGWWFIPIFNNQLIPSIKATLYQTENSTQHQR